MISRVPERIVTMPLPETERAPAAFARATTRAIALVLRALGFGTQKRDFCKRTIAAVFALEQDSLAETLQNTHRLGALLWVCRILANARAQLRQRAARSEHEVVCPLGQMINRTDVS